MISVVSITSTRRLPVPYLEPSVPADAVPVRLPEPKGQVPEPSQNAVFTSAIFTSPASINSDAVPIAVPSPNPASSARTLVFTAPAASNRPSFINTNPEQPTQAGIEPQPSSTLPSDANQSAQITSALSALPTGDSAGIIAPDQGSDDGPLTLPRLGDANIGGIIGGVIGGVAALALISGLLFCCLRKRKTSPHRWHEKRTASSSVTKKLKPLTARIEGFLAKMKARKTKPGNSSYQKHVVQNSVSSVYSTNSNGRIGSASESQEILAVGRAESFRSTASKKSELNLFQKKQTSISSNYCFPGTDEDGSYGNDNRTDPFADPLQPKDLLLPDHHCQVTLGRSAVPPTAAESTRDPSASISNTDRIAIPSREALISTHRRNQSSSSALRSHPPSSLYPTNPFEGPYEYVLPPSQAVLPNSNRRRSSVALPSFNATSTVASRDSQYTSLGEPGPTRPSTGILNSRLPTSRTVRQSDPFDLDRPEVLGFGDVLGRREVRASVTRQATRNKRTSSVGNWGNTADGPYQPFQRDSAKPDPLWGVNGK